MRERTEWEDDALAIVGLAFRLPGALTTLDELWAALSAGQDLITDLPPDRFDASRFFDGNAKRAGKSYTFAGGYLGDIAGFDADYFGISPREANLIDPQQRLLLEMTAEAFDDAGIAPASVAGTSAAVFVGMSDMGYMGLQMMAPESIAAHTVSGGSLSIASNRLSYAFDLRGPSMTIDTACSSVMVAFHQACQTVLAGGSDLAVVGGANLLLSPHTFVGFSKATMLSPLGRCAAFSADADGFVRAEGGGVFLVKRLSAALAGGDRVHAVILATETNTDGHTSGMTVPSASAQEALLRDAYGKAGVEPDDVTYLEAHGTGTPAGDPVECHAIGQALGRRRSPGHPLPIGSVKTNLGHMEPASGIPGILKAILVLRHRVIPPSLHGRPPNPSIDFDVLGLAPVHESRSTGGGRGVVGVNSFGFGGANAHAVLAEPPDPRPPQSTNGQSANGWSTNGWSTNGWSANGWSANGWSANGWSANDQLPVVVSGRTGQALGEAADRLARQLAVATPSELYDICYTATRRRGLHSHRAVVLAATPEVAAQRLAALSRGEPADGSARGMATSRGRVAFVFSGNGSQWPAMGADLLEAEPVFRAAIEQVDRALRPLLGWSVMAELAAPAGRSRLQQTAFGQPALFALQVGLVELLASRGIRPAAVMGHSVGEVAAAHAAGALDLAAACRVIASRSRAQALTAGQGGMAAVGLSRAQAEEALAPFSGRLEIAAVNTERDVTVSGELDAIAELQSRLDASVFFRQLDVECAFHSRFMDPIEEPLRDALADLRPSEPTVPFVSTVTGGPTPVALDAGYWWDNVRRPVMFAEAGEHLRAEGHDVFVEVGPHPVLSAYLRRIAGSTSATAIVPTLRRDTDARGAIDASTAALIAAGAPIDTARWFPRTGRVVDLPAYPWQRERHWRGTVGQWVRTSGDGTIDHPLLGERMPLLEPTWLGTVEPALLPWLEDHKVVGAVLMPAVGYVEMAMAAGRRVLGAPVEVTDLVIPAPLPLPWDEPMAVRIQTSMSTEDGAIRIASTTATSQEWRLHAQGRVRRLLCAPPPPVDLTTLQNRMADHWGPTAFYAMLDRKGLNYGADFQVLHELHVGCDEVLARYRSDIDQTGYEAHPTILDGALHAGAPLAEGLAGLPGAIDRTRLWRQPAATGFVHLRQRSQTQREVCWDIVIGDDDGTVVAELQGCRIRRVGVEDAPPPRHVTVMRAATPAGERRAASPSPGPRALAASAAGRITDLKDAFDEEGYEVFTREQKRSVAHFTMSAIHDMVGRRPEFTTDDLLAAGMLPKYVPLWRLLISSCEDLGLVECQDDGAWRPTGEPARTDIMAKLLGAFPTFAPEMILVGRYGKNLSEILRGRRDMGEILLGDSGLDTYEHLYDTAPLVGWNNQLALVLAQAMIAFWPSDRPLRVLEVGAGTGGMTAALLPAFRPELTEYVFTDVSAGFFASARTRFQRFSFVEYRRLDIDDDLGGQGFVEGSFDLIVASNVLHVARDLRFSLRSLGRLLVPGGQLLAVEAHDPDVLAGFNSLDQFWAFTDTDLRSSSPLLPRDRWPAVLRECGFDEVEHIGADREPMHSDFSVILARRSDPVLRARGLPGAEPEAAWEVAVEDPSDRSLAEAVAGALSAAGGRVVVTTIHGDEEEWAGRVPVGKSIVYVLGGQEDDHVEAAAARAARRFAVLRGFSKACIAFPPQHGTTLWVVTRPSGALPEPERPLVPADAAMWGAARTLGNECTGVVRRVSWERSGDIEADADRLALELLVPSTEDEVALTTAGRFVPRQIEQSRPLRMVGRHQQPYQLELRHPGLHHELAWVEAGPVTPAADEVVIEVRAAALNYHDVMIAMGMLPADTEEDLLDGKPSVGFECAGVVTAIGTDVTALRPGDRVCGIAPRAFASHVVSKADVMVEMPDGMDFAHAATLPVAFLTVHHSLEHLARLTEGETVLVHGAAGGVGLAAIQHAQLVGARVIATAGTPAKRDLLSMLGVEHVLDSRSLAFADQIMALTGGAGVDVVLNSLSGEAIPRGLELLRPHGRFVELGKRDIYANSRIMLGAFRNNISLFCVDVAQVIATNSLVARPQVRAIVRRVAAGEYRPLLHRTYPAGRITEAFRLMQHSRHIGKVVVTFDDPVPVERNPAPLRLDPQGTYLITGGLSGLGAAMARGLGQKGARHLALVGRRGLASPEAEELIASLAGEGVEALAYAADAGDPDAMSAVVASIDASGHSLRGVLHSAMQLDDGKVEELDGERFRTALAPKLQGGMVLDALTRNRPLDFFVAYSSMAALVGHYRQSNYSAGNLFLEALVRHRRHLGLPGVAVAWAGISEVGYVVRRSFVDAMVGLGLQFVSPDEALQATVEVVGLPDAVVCVGGVDWGRMSAMLPLLKSPRLAGLLPPLIEGTEYRRDEFVTILAESTPEEARRLVEDALAGIVASVLQTSVERVDRTRRLDQMGMDSLMTLELVSISSDQFHTDISLRELVNSAGTITAIAELFLQDLGIDTVQTAPAAIRTPVSLRVP